MNNKTLSLFHQFEMEVLRRLVEENPQKATELVLKYYQQYSELYQRYKALQKACLKSINDLLM